MRRLSYLLVVLAFLSGCGNKDKSSPDKTALSDTTSITHIYANQEPFKGWERYRYQNIVFIHPPNHLHQEKFEDFAKIFSTLARQTCVFLRKEPADSIVIYFYSGVGYGMSVTQKDTPFSDGNVIHFWFPSFFGPPIVKHLLPKWYDGEPKHKFLKDGIIALLDGSSQNYHEYTLKFIDSGTFIPLLRLSDDTTVNVDAERYQSAEAASFVDFVVYAYGIKQLKDLYSSNGSFAIEVERVFKMPLPQLEERWILFVKTFAGKKTPEKN